MLRTLARLFVTDPNIEMYPIHPSNNISLCKSLKCLKCQTKMYCLHGCNISNVWLSTRLNEDLKKIQIKNKNNKRNHKHVCLLGKVYGLCLNKHWNFPAFLFLFIYFLSVLFSQYCNASLDITQASLSCSESAESNLVRSAAARRIRLSFFRLLWNVPFFFQHPKYTRQPNCWHVWEGQRDSCILSCPTMQNSTLFI